MTRKEIIKDSFLNEVKKLANQYPNDMDLGKHIRIALCDIDARVKKLSEEEEWPKER